MAALSRPTMPMVLPALRRADWLDSTRARSYQLILLAVTIGIAIFWILATRHGIDPEGKPLGTDFLAFWSAARLALSGGPADAYDLVKLYVVERGSMPVDPGLSSFLYPPPFLLFCLPFGLLPYFASLALWLATTGAAYGLVVRRWLGEGHGAAITILAFPAIITNIGHGQNGFLTAALLGGGLWLLDRRPWIAGALLGALIIKPQIAFAVPALILAGRHGRAMLAGIASASVLGALSWLSFGSATWSGFLAGGGTARAILEQGLVEPGKMVSVLGAIMVLHGNVAMAYAAQAVAAIAAVTVVAIVAARRGAAPDGAAALCAAATALISPFFLDYDLTVTAIPLAWLYRDAQRRGFLAWEKLILAAGYILPLIARDLALGLGLPIAPVVLAALLGAVARAVLQPELRSSPCRR